MSDSRKDLNRGFLYNSIKLFIRTITEITSVLEIKVPSSTVCVGTLLPDLVSVRDRDECSVRFYVLWYLLTNGCLNSRRTEVLIFISLPVHKIFTLPYENRKLYYSNLHVWMYASSLTPFTKGLMYTSITIFNIFKILNGR